MGELLSGHRAWPCSGRCSGGPAPASASSSSSLVLPPHAPRSAPKAWLQAYPVLQETLTPWNTNLSELHFHMLPPWAEVTCRADSTGRWPAAGCQVADTTGTGLGGPQESQLRHPLCSSPYILNTLSTSCLNTCLPSHAWVYPHQAHAQTVTLIK